MPGQNLSLLIARIPPKIMLLAMVSLALAAGVLVQNEMTKKNSQIADAERKNSQKEMAHLVVAARDIPEGTRISADALRVETVEAGKVPLGALQEPSLAMGMQSRADIHAGDSILSQSLGTPAAPQGFEAKIQAGHRAITFPVDTTTGVAGFLYPNCHIDVLAQTGSGADAKATPILSDVQVVAVGQTYQKKAGVQEPEPTSSVTVSVLPKDGQKLINAMTNGKLYCLMRSQADHSPLAVRDISTAFPKPQPVRDTELSSVPQGLPPIPKTVQAPVKDMGPLPPVMHNVDVWQANKKDSLTLPQD